MTMGLKVKVEWKTRPFGKRRSGNRMSGILKTPST